MTRHRDWSGRVVLVNPPYATSAWYYTAPPLGLLEVAATLKSGGNDNVHLVDLALAMAEGTVSPGQGLVQSTAHMLSELEGDVYGFSVQCFNFPVALHIARRLHDLRPRSRIVFGGHHAGAVGDEISRRFPFVDSVVAGPLSATKGPWPQGVTGPTPDYAAAPSLERYRAVSDQSIGIVDVARGCPFSCDFCSVPHVNGHDTVYRPLDQVLCQIDFHVEHGTRYLQLVADNLTADVSYLRPLLAALRKRADRVAWSCMTRANLVSPEILSELAQAGCYSVLYGIESGSPEVRQQLGKPSYSSAFVEELVAWNVTCGINASVYLMVNLPGEADHQLAETLRLASRLSVLDAGCCHLQPPRPVPGSRLWDRVRGTMTPKLYSPYAETLHRTLQDGVEDVWDTIVEHQDICSTYCVAKGPLEEPTADALAWLGNRVLEAFPVTSAGLAEQGKLIDLFRILGVTRDGEEWRHCADGPLAEIIEEPVRSLDPKLSAAMSLEACHAG